MTKVAQKNEAENEKISDIKPPSVPTARIPKSKPIPELMTTPMLGSIDDLLKETRRELGERPIAKRDLNLEEVREVLGRYKKTTDSPSTKITLENVIVDIVDQSIHITVPSSVSKEEIGQELELYQQLRDKFNNNDLLIQLIVDRDKFPGLQEMQSRKIYTMKEKYDHLIGKNPELEKLVKKLKLKIDQE